MKVFTLSILLLLNVALAFAKCGKTVDINVYNDGVTVTHMNFYNQGTSPVAFMDAGDSMTFTASANSNNCWYDSLVITTIRNGDTLFHGGIGWAPDFYHFVATDTGHYTFRYLLAPSNAYYFSITVQYPVATALQEQSAPVPFRIYPTVSGGIYNISRPGNQSISVQITDLSGRIVASNTGGVSAINLTGAAAGIYFFAIVDERKNVWRGRIVKE